MNSSKRLYQNNLDTKENEDKNFLKLDLKGPKNNQSGLGTKVAIRFEDGSFQYYEHQVNRGYLSTVHSMAHFGLGPQKRIEALEIVWPDGNYQLVKDVSSNQTVSIDYKEAAPLNGQLRAFSGNYVILERLWSLQGSVLERQRLIRSRQAAPWPKMD